MKLIPHLPETILSESRNGKTQHFKRDALIVKVGQCHRYGSALSLLSGPVPEFIDQVFVKTSPKRSFSMIEYERFGLIFAQTGSINSGTGDVLGKEKCRIRN
jgi:hypothetical protein